MKRYSTGLQHNFFKFLLDYTKNEVVRKVVVRLLPKNFLPQRLLRSFFGVTSKKRFSFVFLQTLGAIFWSQTTLGAFLSRFSEILSKYSGILPRCLTNQNFWGCACPPTPYTNELCHHLNKIKYIHQSGDTDHVYAIVRTGPRATNVVRAGDLVPAGTMLVTPRYALSQWAMTGSDNRKPWVVGKSMSLT